jgi:hypothetical protein
VGVLFGLLITSGYKWWETRRSEVQRAFVAATLMTEELADLGDRLARPATALKVLGSPPDDPLQGAREAWTLHGQALAVYMTPDAFAEVGATLRGLATVERPGQPELDRLDWVRQRLHAFAVALRVEHNRFILWPLFDKPRRNTLDGRLADAWQSPQMPVSS